MTVSNQLPIMLLEPNALLRQTVTLTAISIGIGTVWQAANNTAAQEMLNRQPLAGAVIALDAMVSENLSPLSMIESIRAGSTASHAAIPVYVIVHSCDQALLTRLTELQIERILIRPLKARMLIEALSNIFNGKPTKVKA